MKFLKKLHILLLLLICNSLWSQSKFDIKGRVIDKETNEMVEGATVRLLSLPDSSFVKGEVTNELGSFTISGIKKGQICVECLFHRLHACLPCC